MTGFGCPPFLVLPLWGRGVEGVMSPPVSPRINKILALRGIAVFDVFETGNGLGFSYLTHAETPQDGAYYLMGRLKG